MSTANLLTIKEAPPLGVGAGALIFVNPAMAATQWLTWVAFAWAIYFDVYKDEPVQQLSQQLKALQADMSEIRALLVEHLDSPQRGA